MNGFKYMYDQGLYTIDDLKSFMPYVISQQDYEYITGANNNPGGQPTNQ